MVEKSKLLKSLEKLEIDSYDTEKEARIDSAQCKPTKLFNLISRSST